jgi:hypothetical protein
VTIATDKAAYRQGQTVNFTIRATNTGKVGCRVDEGGTYVGITDPAGHPIQMPSPPGVSIPHSSGSPPSSTAPPPGEPHEREAPNSVYLPAGWHVTVRCDWNGNVNDPSRPGFGKPADPGAYHATAYWQYPTVTSTSVAFQLTK